MANATVNVWPPDLSRTDLLINRQGILSETFPRALAPSPNGLMVSGTIYYGAMPLKAGDLVSFLGTCITIVGAAVTRSKLGLFHPDTGALLATTADQGTAWHSTGMKDIPVATPYMVPVTDVYYAGFIATAGTMPGMPRTGIGTANAFFAASVNSGRAPFYSQTGQTDFVDPATYGAGTGPGIVWIYAR